MSTDEKKNGSGGFDSDWSIDWSQSDEMDLNLDDIDDPQDLERQFWAPYAESHPEDTRAIPTVGRIQPKQSNPTGAPQRQPAPRAYPEDAYADHQTERELRRAQRERRKESKRKRRRLPAPLKALIYIVFVIGGSVLLATVGWVAANDVLALNKAEATAYIEISDTSTLTEVSQELKSENIIEYPWLFRLYCVLTDSLEELTEGAYEVNTDMDYHALCSALRSSSTAKASVDVTIPEGYTVDQIFALLVEKGVCESTEELEEIAATHDYAFDFLEDVPLGDYHRLEGYLFPDTYTFYIGHDPLYVINKMLVNFDSQFTSDMEEQAADLGYSVYEILTVASIIEKETNGTDMRNIAAVIYNRLSSTETLGKLQMDSTIQYVLERTGVGRKDELESTDFEIDSPYNTYLYAGLPEGPICNPSLSSIQAALSPNDVDYLYYFHDNSGDAHFYADYDTFLSEMELYLSDDYVPEEDDTNYEAFEDE